LLLILFQILLFLLLRGPRIKLKMANHYMSVRDSVARLTTGLVPVEARLMARKGRPTYLVTTGFIPVGP